MSETKKFNITPVEGISEVVIREGTALPLKEPVKVIISGVISAPLIWILKRVSIIATLLCNIKFSYENSTITYTEDENNAYGAVITGKLEESKEFKEFGINSSNYKTPLEMSEFFKMHRSFFENHQAAMSLVTVLKNFKAKVDRQVEQEVNLNKGDKRLILNQVVETNVPEKFNLVIPIFKGADPITFEVETYFNPNDMTCTLVSPQAQDIIESTKKKLIDDVIAGIQEIAPNVPIIEV